MKNICLLTLKALLLVVLVTSFSSCEKNEIYQGTDLRFFDVTIDKADWGWNPIYKRYEYTIYPKELNNFIYNNGVVQAFVFVQEKGIQNGQTVYYETQKMLPFVQSFDDDGTSLAYTEMISFDTTPTSITFYTQRSDMSDVDKNLGTYDFKVSLISN